MEELHWDEDIDPVVARRSPRCYDRCAGHKDYSVMKPTIFTIQAAWDDEARVWAGHCDDIPAAADAPTLDELLQKITAMALDVVPDNYPDLDTSQLFLHLSALREAEPAA